MKEAGMGSRVKQEVTIHFKLRHPSILKLLTFFEDEAYVYLVLELCHNGELQRYLRTIKLCLTDEEGG
jgi:polo-like kinase 4